MDSFNDIKSLWQTDGIVDLPSPDDIKKAIHQYSHKNKRNNGFVIALLFCALIALVLVMSFGDFERWTTYFGLLILGGVGIYTVYTKLKKQNTLNHLETLSNSDFLTALEAKENRTCIGKSKTLTTLFIIWTIGFSFYIYEFVSQSTNYLIFGYSALFLFILFMWFVYQPFMTKRYQKDIQKTIQHINHLQSQIKNNE